MLLVEETRSLDSITKGLNSFSSKGRSKSGRYSRPTNTAPRTAAPAVIIPTTEGHLRLDFKEFDSVVEGFVVWPLLPRGMIETRVTGEQSNGEVLKHVSGLVARGVKLESLSIGED